MQEPLFMTVTLEDFVPADHPLRQIRLLVNDALKRLSGLFSVIYADNGRAADQLGKLLRTLFLCDYFSNVAFRRELHTQLNRGESVHQLLRAIYTDRVAPSAAGVATKWLPSRAR